MTVVNALKCRHSPILCRRSQMIFESLFKTFYRKIIYIAMVRRSCISEYVEMKSDFFVMLCLPMLLWKQSFF